MYGTLLAQGVREAGEGVRWGESRVWSGVRNGTRVEAASRAVRHALGRSRRKA